MATEEGGEATDQNHLASVSEIPPRHQITSLLPSILGGVAVGTRDPPQSADSQDSFFEYKGAESQPL